MIWTSFNTADKVKKKTLKTEEMQTSISSLFTQYCDFRYLHFINVMTYDLHGSWESVTGENTPLYAGPADRTDYQRKLNVVSISVQLIFKSF